MRDQPPPTATDEPTAPALTDAELVARAKTDRAAFAPLYHRYFDDVFRFCYYRIGNWQEAEDAAGDVFEKAIAKLAGFQSDGRTEGFRCWLLTIAHNDVRNRGRDRRVDHPLAAAASVTDSGPSPEESALAADDHRFIASLLARLESDDQRAMLELRLAGLNDAEIARALDRSHDAVRKAQSRAIQKLRALLVSDSGKGGGA